MAVEITKKELRIPSNSIKKFTYTNPITSDPAMAMRDHQILRVGDIWYMTGTAAPYWRGLNPGVRLFSSTNLLDWTFETWLIDAAKLPDDCFYKGRFWASEIHRAHDRFWLTVNRASSCSERWLSVL